jgi:hypothetical protein
MKTLSMSTKILLFWGALAVVAGASFGFRQNAPPPPVAASLQAGALAALPDACASGALYVATDEPPGQQLQVCAAGAWYPALSVGGSGALALQAGALDIVPSIVPRKTAENTWLGRNTFADLRLAASTASCVDAKNDLGRLALDTSDAANTKLQVCGWQAGKLGWLKAYLVPANANGWGVAQ